MDKLIEQTLGALEAAKRLSRKGNEYWMGRALQAVLGYSEWRNFESVIQKAKAACDGSGVDSNNHFVVTTKKVQIGSATEREVTDFYLSRYACYLIAMNGNSEKSEIAAAQTYFAIQTRRQEIQDADFALDKRSEARIRLTDAFKSLNSTAKNAGVQNYALFHDAGVRGLYEIGLTEIKRRKGIGDKEDLYDRIGRAELAANEFRVTQAEQKIVREDIKGQVEAMSAHRTVGSEVRATIKKIGGTMPEELRAEPSLKKLEREQKKKLRKPPADAPKRLT